MVFLDKLNMYLNQALIWIAGLFLAAMIFLVTANVFLRIFGMPVSGTFELMGYFSAVSMAFALGYTQIKHGHISVDVLFHTFPVKIKRLLHIINCLICTIFFAVIAWQISIYATTLLKTGEVTETLRVAYYPFTYAVALGCAVLSLVFLTDMIKSIFSREEQ